MQTVKCNVYVVLQSVSACYVTGKLIINNNTNN